MTNRWGAAHVLVAAVALVIGLVLGGLGPRSEARVLREKVDALSSKDCSSRGSGMGREIAEVFRGRPLDLPDAPAAEQPAGADPASEGKDRAVSKVEGAEAPDGQPEDQPTPEEALTAAREAMEMRRAQARAALAEAGLTEEQMATIDTAMSRMNADLSALTETFVASLQDGAEPDRREMMVFAADTLDVLIEGEDALYGVLDEQQREGLDEAALDPFSYVDGQVVENLMQLER